MRRNSSLFGLLGLVLLLFAGVAAWLTRAQSSVDVLYIAVNGVLGAAALVVYLSTGLGQLRESLSARSTKYGANTVVGSLLFIAILVVLNFLSFKNHKRIDLTEQGIYSLSSQAKQVVSGLKEPLTVQAFVEGGVQPVLEDLFRTFAYESDKFTFELVDPVEEPHKAEAYDIRAYNSVRVAYGAESTVITEPTEETLTNAIIKVTRTSKKTVCFVEGHGESSLESAEAFGLSSLRTALKNENWEVEPLLLASQEKVPEKCSMVAIVGAVKPFLDNELRSLEAYLDGGGRALVMLRPRVSAELLPTLAKWGVQVDDTVIVDQVLRIFEGPALGLNPLVRTYGSHEITQDFAQITIFPMARSLRSDASAKPGLNAVELATTSETSWAETNVAALFESNVAAKDDADRAGPVAVAVATQAKPEGATDDKETRLVVFGSAQVADNRELEGTYFNRDLLLNSFAWLAGEADLVSIRPREIRTSRVQFSGQEGTIIFYLAVLLIPQLLLLSGLAVWWRRE